MTILIKRSLQLALFFQAAIYCSNMWKITLSNGYSFSCTDIVSIDRDSLMIQTLGQIKSLALNDVTQITEFKGNVNIAMLIGASCGGTIGFMVDNIICGNNKIDFKNSGVTAMIIGLIGGTLLGHFFTINYTIDLSHMPIYDKQQTVEENIVFK